MRYSGGALTLIAYTGPNESYTSADGRFIAFWQQNSAYLYDTSNGALELVSVSDLGEGANDQTESGTISDDGRYVGAGGRRRVGTDPDTGEEVQLRRHDGPRPNGDKIEEWWHGWVEE